MTVVGRWEFERWGEPAAETVRALHQPAGRFRVSPASYPPGTAFGGTSRASRKYVLAGACAFTVGSLTWELRAGDVAELPEGTYEFHVVGSASVELVSVWELPPACWGTGDA
jgi:hypothetical protein